MGKYKQTKIIKDYLDLSSMELFETLSYIWSQWRKQKLPLIIFLGLSSNLVIVPAVYAATGKLEQRQVYAISGLSIITFGIIIYLFDVVFRPERY
jgi:F subunit of K+-transporting ATPase (Potass_KdpF)